MTALPTHARAVIVGGGIMGASVAFHLAKLGWSDVVLLERGALSCGFKSRTCCSRLTRASKRREW